MSTNISNFGTLQNHFNAVQSVDPAVPHLGDITFWALHEAETDRATLEQVWVAAGLNRDLLPPPQTPEKALRQAVRSLTSEHGRMLRQHPDTASRLTYSVVREIFESDDGPEYARVSKFELDRTTGILTGDPTDPTFTAVQTAYQHFSSVATSREIMVLITNTLKSFSAVTLRDSGGVYWVPRTSSAGLRQMKDAIEKIGKSRVFLLPVFDTAEANATLQAAAQASLDAEVADLTKEIEAFQLEGTRGPAVLERRLERFEELRARAHLYGGILNVTAKDLDAAVLVLEDSVNTMLAEFDPK